MGRRKGFGSKVTKRLVQQAVRSTYDAYPWKPSKPSKRKK